MRKREAVDIFGGSIPDIAKALSISRQAIYQWQDDLSQDQADRVIGAALRCGKKIPLEYLSFDDLPATANQCDEAAPGKAA
ncbi:hypothetical protein DJ031_06740 [bacterium endosymbiont of Escarpia laminata]|nr:MAG: hypothetical protein DJ031_06740 [bacterium endosymbiont of Escarpia laminata]